MPIPIKFLFEDDNSALSNIHKMPDHEDITQMAAGWPNINVDLQDFPAINHPQIGTKEFSKDLNLVQKSFLRPTCQKNFLEISNQKPFMLFEKYVNKNNLNYDMTLLDDLNKDLANLVLTLKFKYNRLRPKKQMKLSDIQFPHKKITDNNSPSFPSGHSAHAYFNAKMIASEFPDHELKLRTLAEMISQSRLDLGKHYPSDVSFGKYVGEYCANKVNSNTRKTIKEQVSTKHLQSNYARQAIKRAEDKHNKSNNTTSYLDELCEFIIRSNSIERYPVSITESLEAAKSFLNGLPIKYCSDNKYIRSHLSALEEAAKYNNVDTPKKVCNVHQKLGSNVLERGEPGVLRDFEHYARSTGHSYTHPNNILKELLDWCQTTQYDDPFMRHIKYECIHPFSDGNGRSGRIVLASDLKFDLKVLNDMIGNDYIPLIVKYQDSVTKNK